MTALLDTNVLVRHLTGDPPEQARRATRFLGRADDLRVPDLVLAELVYVLESVYRLPRHEVARLATSVVTFRSVTVDDEALIVRALDLYAGLRIDFAEAYLVAYAERTGVDEIVSFDRAFDRATTVRRVEPPR